MAHSFIYQPQNPAPCLNDVDYLIQADDSGSGVYTAIIYVYGDLFNTITFNPTLDSNRRFWLRLGEILKSYAPIQFVNGIGNNDGNAFSYPSVFTYAVSVYIYKDGAQQGFGFSATNKKYIRAGLDYTKFIQSSWVMELLGQRYASILPKKRTIQLDEYFCISAYLPAIPIGNISFDFLCYKSDGTLIPGSGAFGDGSASFICTFTPTHNIINLVTTFNNLNQNPSWSNIFTNIDQVAYFEVYIRDVAAETRFSQIAGCFRYYIKPKDSLFPLRSFLFFNSRGGYDVLTFSGKKIALTEPESQEANVYYPANYLIGQAQTKEFNHKRNDSFKINSGYVITPEWKAAYQDFIHSEDRYEMVNLGDLDAALPIKLKKSVFEIDEDNKEINSLDFEYSYRFENFGFTNLLKV